MGGQVQTLGKNYPSNGYLYVATEIDTDGWRFLPKFLKGFNSRSPVWAGELRLSKSW